MLNNNLQESLYSKSYIIILFRIFVIDKQKIFISYKLYFSRAN